MQMSDTGALAVGAVAVGIGLPEMANVPEIFSHVLSGLYGAGLSTYLRFRNDETNHPWTEWLVAILIGIGAGLIFGPSLHGWTGWNDGTQPMIITIVAFAGQKIAEIALKLLDAGAQANWAAHTEKVLAGLGDAIVKRFRG